MLKKYKNFKKDVDPYDEEIWDDEFKKGDVVICIDPIGSLVYGREYIVTDITEMESDDIIIDVIDDTKTLYYNLFKDRFKKKI